MYVNIVCDCMLGACTQYFWYTIIVPFQSPHINIIFPPAG